MAPTHKRCEKRMSQGLGYFDGCDTEHGNKALARGLCAACISQGHVERLKHWVYLPKQAVTLAEIGGKRRIFAFLHQKHQQIPVLSLTYERVVNELGEFNRLGWRRILPST